MDKEELFSKIKALIDHYDNAHQDKCKVWKETYNYIENIPFVKKLETENKLLKNVLNLFKNKQMLPNEDSRSENITIEIIEKNNNSNSNSIIEKINNISSESNNNDMTNHLAYKKEESEDEDEDEDEDEEDMTKLPITISSLPFTSMTAMALNMNQLKKEDDGECECCDESDQ